MQRIWILALAFVIGACGNPAIKRGYAETPEELGQAVVEALNSNSESDLHRLRVDKDSYINELWPEFSSPGFTGEFAWGNLNKKCVRGVLKWLRQYGGKDYTFVRIRFTEPSRDYGSFNLRRGTVLTVRTPEGDEKDLKILGSVVEKNGRYRLLSYDD